MKKYLYILNEHPQSRAKELIDLIMAPLIFDQEVHLLICSGARQLMNDKDAWKAWSALELMGLECIHTDVDFQMSKDDFDLVIPL